MNVTLSNESDENEILWPSQYQLEVRVYVVVLPRKNWMRMMIYRELTTNFLRSAQNVRDSLGYRLRN